VAGLIKAAMHCDDMEFGVLLYFNSSQHSLNISIPINNSPTKLSLRLLNDDFSCATIVPSTAHIIILDADGKNNGWMKLNGYTNSEVLELP
jgi:hypothetical protein